MDQKHAMLYAEMQPNARQTNDQRALASTAIGLPTERHGEPPPPSYDIAVSTSTQSPTIATETHSNDNWYPNSTFHAAMNSNSNSNSNAAQHIMQSPQFSRNDITTRSFIEPNYPQYQQTSPAVNIINQQHIPKLGPHPCTVFCPACGTARSTKMAYTANTRTHFCALLLCLVGWCCCACLVPYCTNSCRSGNHYCTACNTFLGTYNMNDTP